MCLPHQVFVKCILALRISVERRNQKMKTVQRKIADLPSLVNGPNANVDTAPHFLPASLSISHVSATILLESAMGHHVFSLLQCIPMPLHKHWAGLSGNNRGFTLNALLGQDKANAIVELHMRDASSMSSVHAWSLSVCPFIRFSYLCLHWFTIISTEVEQQCHTARLDTEKHQL